MLDVKNIQSQRIEWFLSVVRNCKQAMQILDIGCQAGDVCARLKSLGYDACGVDANPDIVEQARQRYPDIAFELANCEERVPFESRSFDLVWAGDVIEHIRFTDVFVNEINRVLKPDGLFVLTTPLHNRLKGAMIALLNFEKHYDPEFPHYRFYTPKSLARVLRRRGMEIQRISRIGRIAPIAQAMGVVAVKTEDRQVMSEHRY